MAFSFNPTQTPGGAPAAPGVPQVNIQSPGGPMHEAPPSIPDSPFLFMRNRDKEMTINAYLQLLLILVAVLSIAASVIVFAYAQYLSVSIDKKKADLAEKEANFKSYPFNDMQALSDRLVALNSILKGYVSSRSPLSFLEKVVENQAVFNDFTYKNDKGAGVIGFTIITGNQRALIQQLDALNLKKYSTIISNPKMESFNDSGSFFKAKVTAPVSVQGFLSDEVLLILSKDSASSTRP